MLGVGIYSDYRVGRTETVVTLIACNTLNGCMSSKRGRTSCLSQRATGWAWGKLMSTALPHNTLEWRPPQGALVLGDDAIRHNEPLRPVSSCSLSVPRRVTFDLPSSFSILNVNKMIPVLHSSDRSTGVYASQNSNTGVMFRKSPVVATQSVGGAILGNVVAVVGFASSSERYVSW